MSSTWNHFGDDAAQDPAVYNMIRDAIIERDGTVTGVAPVLVKASGDDAQAHAAIANAQLAVENLINARRWFTTASLAGLGILGIVDLTGSIDIYRVTVASIFSSLWGGTSWTRKVPREFATAVATAYTDGSAFANGHNARNRADGIVYTRTAGAWVNAGVVLPDLISAPDGRCQADDVVIRENLEQMRDVLNKLEIRVESSVWTTTGINNVRDGSSGSQTTDAAAQAAAAGDYGHPSSGAPAPYAYAEHGPSGSVFVADMSRAEHKLNVATSFGQPMLPVNKTLYIYTGAQGMQGVQPPVFDAQGDGFADGVMTLIETQTLGGGATSSQTTNFVGQLGQPAFGPSGKALGYQLFFGTLGSPQGSMAIAVTDYGVSGGFTYSHLSP